MDAPFLSILLSTLVGLSVVYAVYLFLSNYSEAVGEARAHAVESGDSSLAELYINISPSTFFALRVLLGVIAFFACAPIGGVGLAAVAALLAFFAPAIQLNRLKAQRSRKVETQLVDALELLGNSLKSGLTLPHAVEVVVKEFPPPMRQEFARVLA
ncbi:MAG: hypothetical protein IT290_00030, partial [Deltaproteobacteria bacterium]|nr:hypothetical protein [Deltaproteobacteria bacterium]